MAPSTRSKPALKGNINLEQKRPPFEAKEHAQIELEIPLPENWLAVQACACTFPSAIFDTVMLNLIKNPNITSSHLFRADIYYDSDKDHHFQPEAATDPCQEFVKYMKEEYRPIPTDPWPGFQLERTIVRKLIPRNPQLDPSLMQTCHFLRQTQQPQKDCEPTERTLVLYIPHEQDPSRMPFYHPVVSRLAFLHSSTTSSSSNTLTIFYSPFPSLPSPLTTPKLLRTALKLLQTIHKHGQGQLAGYTKRVHLDQLIPQPRYQNTYSALKTKYGRTLSEKWVEVTDPGKHVFEDIAIAAWLIELWRDMYAGTDGEAAGEKPSFPGFVDIGCGNGVLTYLLLSEGYRGFGFDARARKTWAIFPRDVRACLRQQVLIPKIFASSSAGGDDPRATQLEDDDDNGEKEEEGEGKQEEPEEQKTQKGEEEPEPEPEPPNPHTTHDGIFPRGTFIISNHADELTAWTPLLAHLNKSPFIAIPCCSHDLSGARFRAPTEKPPASTATDPETRLPQQKQQPGEEPQPRSLPLMATTTTTSSPPQAAETGTLRKSSQQTKMPSAYATLCGYVARLAREVGYEVETDTLRIPSTRNACVVGRRRRRCAAGMERGGGEDDERVGDVVRIVERELKRGVGEVAGEWRERAEGLMGKSGSGH